MRGATLAGGRAPKKQPESEDAIVPSKPARRDAADLTSFDGASDARIEAITGAVVAVVAGENGFQQGLRFADVEARRPVDPEKTLFRIASISKLFTWTAVMQLVEAGKIDLNTDINTYLKDLKIPATFEQPITMKHLLTHTPGFEDLVIGLFAHKPEEVGPLVDMLKGQLPVRVRPPGLVTSYSNHGTAIAGHAVASVSGMPWEDYVEQRILNPLGMTHTLVRQPGEDKLPADLSKGYKWEGGRFVAKGFEYIPDAPAGCMLPRRATPPNSCWRISMTARLGSGRILKRNALARCVSPSIDPAKPAPCVMACGTTA